MSDDQGLIVKPAEDPSRDLGYDWQGVTVFENLPLSMDIDEEDQPVEQGRKPKGLRVPGEPSESERKLHELTHLPFRSWCKHCIMAKGRHTASRKLKDRQPVIQVDYCFARTDPKLEMQTLLVAADILTGLSMAVVVPTKGGIAYSTAELRMFVYECGRTFGILQYDQESSVKAVCQRVCKEIGGLSTRAAPKDRPQSHGSVGAAQRTLYSQVRTLMYHV